MNQSPEPFETNTEIRRFREQRLVELFVENHFLLKELHQEKLAYERVLLKPKKPEPTVTNKPSLPDVFRPPKNHPALRWSEHRRMLENPDDYDREAVGDDDWAKAMRKHIKHTFEPPEWYLR